jgi:hypothetical protein
MGLRSPLGLSKTQSAIARVKTPRIETFFIPLERSWSVDCPKWPRMSHLDICSTSYGRKKGWKSNWQFDSRPQKVGNRSDPGACKWSATHRWKALEESYNSGPRPDPSLGRKVMSAQSPRSLNRNSFGTPLQESREKEPFGCKCGGELQRILYGGRWWLPPSPGRGESSESMFAHGLS